MDAASTREELRQVYERRFGGSLAYRGRVWDVLVQKYFERYVRPSNAVLDLGAGYGEFINRVRCAKKYAMDLNPDTASKVSADVEMFQHDCAMRWPLPDNSVDVIFTSNFFEHLPDKTALTQTLREAHRCLKLNGRLIALGPNITYVGGAYWDFIDHHIPLTNHSLAEAFEQAGLHIDSSVAKFLPYTMSDGRKYPLFFVSLYLALPFAWKFFGKQFLVIAVKESV